MAQTTIVAEHPARLALRGDGAGLSWERSADLREESAGVWSTTLDVPEGEVVEFKLLRGDAWSRQRNFTVAGGQVARVFPYFDHDRGRIDGRVRTLPGPFGEVDFEVYLPPSYGEQPGRKFPVLYAHDGHVLFSSSVPDAFDGHTWRLDETLDFLWELGAMRQIIVVAIHSRRNRLQMLTPMPDPRFGGGGGPAHLDWICSTLIPYVDTHWRTRRERERTGILGASLGGLFAFWAAWTCSREFGRAACLSPSFWWDGRAMVREVQKAQCPAPRPWLYIDSGAAFDPFEDDAALLDGFGHTTALVQSLVHHCYTPGQNLQSLAFAGARHDNASWAARLATPLQLLFPRDA